jgi:hypothetical protein
MLMAKRIGIALVIAAIIVFALFINVGSPLG